MKYKAPYGFGTLVRALFRLSEEEQRLMDLGFERISGCGLTGWHTPSHFDPVCKCQLGRYNRALKRLNTLLGAY